MKTAPTLDDIKKLNNLIKELKESGVQGEQGIQGEPGLGFSGLGDWNSATIYALNDVVNYNNSSYFCVAGDLSNYQPDLWPGYWQILAAQGIPGSDANVTKANVEAVLTGQISSHSHAGGSGDMTKAVYDSDDDGILQPTQLNISGKSDTNHTHAGVYAINTDARLSDARTPLAHSHQAFPIGSIFLAVVSTDPATLLGYGTWSAFGAGRVLVGLNSGDVDFDTVEETGGTKAINLAHTHDNHGFTQPSNHADHIVTQPANHAATATSAASAGAQKIGTTTSTVTLATHTHNTPVLAHSGTAVDAHSAHTGGAVTPTTHASNLSATQSIVQPYIVVYMWKRTA